MSDQTAPSVRDRVGYYLFTGLLTATMLYSAGMYIVTPIEARRAFTDLGYPEYLMFPLGVAKLLGLLAVWIRISPLLTNLAYAGYFFNFLLAFFAHWMVRDGDLLPAALAMLFLIGSFVFGSRVFGEPAADS